MRYYIADLHFCHEDMIDRMDKRGFASVDEMNEFMIAQWNSRVRKVDEVVILGDFCLTTSATQVGEILKRLNGKKCLIVGNHDNYIDLRRFDRSLFEWIENYKELNDDKRKVVLSHYPIMCYTGQYRRDSEGNPRTYMLYGHVHNTFDEFLVNEWITMARGHKRSLNENDEPMPVPARMINCFCMFSNYVPLTLDEWIENDRVRRQAMSK